MRERFCEGTRALPAAAGTVCGRWGAGSVNDMIIRESCPRGRPRSFTPMSGMRASASTHAETNAERVREHERPSDQSDPAGFPGPVIRMVRAVALRMIGNASSPRSKPARALVRARSCAHASDFSVSTRVLASRAHLHANVTQSCEAVGALVE